MLKVRMLGYSVGRLVGIKERSTGVAGAVMRQVVTLTLTLTLALLTFESEQKPQLVVGVQVGVETLESCALAAWV